MFLLAGNTSSLTNETDEQYPVQSTEEILRTPQDFESEAEKSVNRSHIKEITKWQEEESSPETGR